MQENAAEATDAQLLALLVVRLLMALLVTACGWAAFNQPSVWRAARRYRLVCLFSISSRLARCIRIDWIARAVHY